MIAYRVFVAGVLAGLSIVCAASAAETPTTGAPATGATTPAATDPAAKPPEADPMVCRSLEPMTGSRLGGRRVCKKKSEWRALTESTRQMMENSQHQNMQSECPATTPGAMC